MVPIKALLLKPLTQWSAAVLIGLAATWWVVEHVGVSTGTAIVHVTEPDVEVLVGDRTYRVEGPQARPLVCELPAGRHELRMSRGGRVLFRDFFTVRRGEQVILTAWVPR